MSSIKPGHLRLLAVATIGAFVGNTCLTLAEPTGVQKAVLVEAAGSATKEQQTEQPLGDRPPRRLDGARTRSLPLPPRSTVRDGDGEKPIGGRPFSPASGLATGLATLAAVLGLFFVTAWAVRRGLPQGPAKLPGDVVEVLGRTPLAGRQFAHLIRCGNKLLLVHIAPGCAETLTEISDPVEVDRLAGLCRQAHPQSATASFRQIFQQFSREKPTEAEKR